jgi:TolA-binding protein
MTLTNAQARVSEGKFDAADSLLSGFAARYPGTSEALEATYWRALALLDPANPHGSVSDAISSLDAYLADPRAHEHLREAAAVRRVATHLDDLSKLASNVPALPKDANTIATTTRAQPTVDVMKPIDAQAAADAEIKRLRDELAKATAELERIRKRLAQPPSGHP